MTESKRISVGNRITIYQRGKKKTWIADFWNDGQHRRVSLKTSNKKVATDRAMKMENELMEGSYHQVNSDTKIETAITSYLDNLIIEDRAEKTIVRYRGELNTFRDFCLKKRVRLLKQITPTLFDQFRSERKVDHKPKTLYHEALVCKSFLKWCVSRHLLRKSPLQEYKLVKPVSTKTPSPSLQEFYTILNGSSERQIKLFKMLGFTGMRSGELKTLRKEDVDLKNNWIYVVSRDGQERTKTRESRKIPIHSELQVMLKKHPTSFSSFWFFNAPSSPKYPAGDHWANMKKLNEQFLNIAKKGGLKTGREENGYTLHSLRHLMETHCVNQGIPQRVIDIWMGHKSDRSMGAVYYDLSDEDSQAFMKKVDFSLPTKKL